MRNDDTTYLSARVFLEEIPEVMTMFIPTTFHRYDSESPGVRPINNCTLSRHWRLFARCVYTQRHGAHIKRHVIDINKCEYSLMNRREEGLRGTPGELT